MNNRVPSLRALYVAQFLSAFVDNMILFIAQAIILRDRYPGYYLPLVQSTFLLSFIVLSPWVGRFADKRPKADVLVVGNLVKAAGIILLLFGIDPALSYAAVGVGAVIYSPAKYGILPFLTRGDDELLRANSSLESYTILAILSGSVAGGYLSDRSITLSLLTCLLLYGLSIAVSRLIAKDAGNRAIGYADAVREFIADAATLFKNRQSHYSLVGTGAFWMASAVLRMIIFAWVPMTLGITSGTAISMIIAVTGIGFAVGAGLAPYFVSIRTYDRTVWFGLGLGGCIFAFLAVNSLAVTVVFLLMIGCLGGIFIVPMNACLQQAGHRTVGAGKTIAVQNFMENSFMFAGVGAYTLASKGGVPVSASLAATGAVMLAVVAYMLVLAKTGNIRGKG